MLKLATMHILLADDTEINRVYLVEGLELEGFVVTAVPDGNAALARARTQRFDGLVLDQRMPGLYGQEVLALLRAEPQAASHAAIAVGISSELDAALAALMLRTGFVAALAKPVRIPLLARALRQQDQRLHGLIELSSGLSCGLDTAARFDDAQALRALGRADLVARLRLMLRRELEQRAVQFGAAVQNAEMAGLRELIHQSLASCAMCGTPRLELHLRWLREAVHAKDWLAAQARLQPVLVEIGALLDELPQTD